MAAASALLGLLLSRWVLDGILLLLRLMVRRDLSCCLPPAASVGPVGSTRCSSTQKRSHSWLLSSVGRTCTQRNNTRGAMGGDFACLPLSGRLMMESMRALTVTMPGSVNQSTSQLLLHPGPRRIQPCTHLL